MRAGLTCATLAAVLLAGCPDIDWEADPNPPYDVVEYPFKHRVGDAPASVLAEDLNGDGRPDYVTANRLDNTVSVLLSEGVSSYADRADYAVGASPRWVALADVSGDGTPDLLTADLESDGVSVLYGQGAGAGAYATAVTLPLREDTAPAVVEAADFDGDGLVDVVTANSGDGTVALLRGTGGGLFDAPAYVWVGDLPRWLSVVSVDGDAAPELVVASRDAGDVAILAWDGAALRVANRVSAGTAPRSVVPGDYDGDGKVDLAVSATGSREVRLLTGDGAGGFTAGAAMSFDAIPSYMTGGDFNRDGDPDLAVLLYTTEETPSPLGVAALLMGDGTGGFETVRYFAVGERSQALVTTDDDGDGTTDLAAADVDAGTVSVTHGRTDGTFASERRYPVGRYPRTIAVGDLDGDNRPEVVVGHRDSEDILVMMNRGDGTFENGPWLDTGDDPKDIELAHIDGDAYLDMAVGNYGTGLLSILPGLGDGTFGAARVFSLRAGSAGFPRSIALADLDLDGDLDVVAGLSNIDRVSILLGNGDGSFAAASEIALGNYPVSVQVARLNTDAWPDLVFVSRNDPDNPSDAGQPWLVRVLGRGDGTFVEETRLAFTISADPIRMLLADVNGDGRPDAVSAHADGNVVDIMTCTSDGRFTRRTLFTGRTPVSPAVADMNRDGLADIVTANKSETLSVLLNRGGGEFRTHFELTGGTDGFEVTPADLDGDGNTDLVVANMFTDDVSVFMGVAP